MLISMRIKPLLTYKALNPGNLKTELTRHTPSFQHFIIGFVLYTPIHGAYTELFAGLSPEVTPAKNGAWSMFSSLFKFTAADLNSPTLGPFRSAEAGCRGFN